MEEQPRPTVEVRIMRRSDKTLYFAVLVRSKVKIGLKNKGILEFKKGLNQRGAVGILAGSLAEMFCEKYSDTLDPSDTAAAAERAYSKLMQENPFVFGIGDEAPHGSIS